MSAQLSGKAPAGTSRNALVWRWKGTRADIARIVRSVGEATGAQGLAIELTDAMGRRTFTDVAEFERALDGVEKFNTVAFEAGHAPGPCKVAVVFDAAATHSPAAVTVLTSGNDPAAVAAAHIATVRLVSVGAREPKNIKPDHIEKWGGIGGIALLVASVLGLVGSESRDAGFVLLVFALFVVGAVSLIVCFGYETLVPRVELLHPGQTPRIQKFAGWIAATVGAVIVGGLVSGAF